MKVAKRIGMLFIMILHQQPALPNYNKTVLMLAQGLQTEPEIFKEGNPLLNHFPFLFIAKAS